jgi:hypothetical protein
MSYFSAFEQACPNIQGALNDLWAAGRFPGATENMPFAEYITSPGNRQGIVAEILPGAGKVKTAEVTYRRRGLLSQARANVANPSCEAEGYIGNQKETYTIDTSVNIATPSEAIPLGAFDDACPPNAEILADKLAWHIDLLDRKVAQTLATQAVALKGDWGASVSVNGSGYFEVATEKANGDINPKAWVKLENALMLSGFPMATPFFGGMTFREFAQLSLAGCCANEGLDVADLLQRYGKAYAYDYYLSAALGDSGNRMLGVAPGALQVLNWTSAPRLAAMGAIWNGGANYLHTVVQSPRLGLQYDLTAKDDCGTLNLNLVATVKTIGLPSDMFAVGDEYEGVTYVAGAQVVNP